MNVEKTTYSKPDSIMYIADHKVTIPVMVSATGVTAGSDGKKIVPAGTVLGGALANVGAGAVAASTATGENAVPAEGILMNDVDVTSGPAMGALLVQGVVDAAKLPAAVNAYQRGGMPGIVFVGTHS